MHDVMVLYNVWLLAVLFTAHPSAGCGRSLPVELDLAVPPGSNDCDEHAYAVQRRDSHSEQEDPEQDGESLLQIAADRDCQCASNFVGLERDDIEREGHRTVADQGENEGAVKNAFTDGDSKATQLATRGGVKEALDCGQW